MKLVEHSSDWLDRFIFNLNNNSRQNEDCSWLRGIKNNAIKALQKEPIPIRKMEGWRYTSVKELMNLPLNFSTSEIQSNENSEKLDETLFLSTDIDSIKVVIRNGQVTSLTGINGNVPDGVIISSMKSAVLNHPKLLSQYFGAAMNHRVDQTENKYATLKTNDSNIFQYINQSVLPDGLFVYIPKNIKLEKPIELVNINSGNQCELIQTHCIMIVEDGAEMTFLDQHMGKSTSKQFSNHQLELFINQNALMKHYYFHNSTQFHNQRYGINRLQENDSQYVGWFGCFGSQWSRLEMQVHFKGENAKSNIKGIQLAHDKQINDIHLDINHTEPGCHSEQHFRGLAMGGSKLVFDGKITVFQGAQKTAAHLSDKNLMLNRKSEINAKPQLEIYTDDVQCSHGTSIGEIDEQQLFYLRSRGISKANARKLLSMGFVAETLQNIEFESLKLLAMDIIEQRFDSNHKTVKSDEH